ACFPRWHTVYTSECRPISPRWPCDFVWFSIAAMQHDAGRCTAQRSRDGAPDMTEMIEFTVNGRKVAVDVAGSTPLLAVLRNTLGLPGTRFGCGLEQCGTCTVLLDRWVGFESDRTVRVRTGKVELGQGVLTALAQIAAEELDVPPQRVRLVSGVTAQAPNEGYTAGSRSIEESGGAIRLVCAEVRK